MKLLTVAGARPNFMKVAPLIREMEERGIENVLVHTGQHYDAEMSQVFFDQLQIPSPDYHLALTKKDRAEQIKEMKSGIQKIVQETHPDQVMVVGDTNSSLAGALAGKEEGIPVSHVEAGLRSFNKAMPEEHNRIEIDRIAEWLFITEEKAREHLLREGKQEQQIFFTGNVMVDTLHHHLPAAKARKEWENHGVREKGYAVVTAHRAENVDSEVNLHKLLDILEHTQEQLPVLFPLHPRTRKNLEQFSLHTGLNRMKNLRVLQPAGYTSFLSLELGAQLIITDSGGVQEESTVLQVPCITIREETERPVTVEIGTNTVVGLQPERVREEVRNILQGNGKKGEIPEGWDGKAAERILDVVEGNA